MYIETSKLIPTHNRLRNPELVKKFLGNLSILDKSIENKEDKISVGEIEGSLYVFNSHHRIVAVDIAFGRIEESLLNIKSYTLDEMLSVNIDVGWVTPFDPHFFCRIPDFKILKDKILDRRIPLHTLGNNTIKYLTPDTNDIFYKLMMKVIEPRTVQTLGELYNV